MLSFTVPAVPPSVNHYRQPFVRRGRIHWFVKPEAQVFKLMVRDAAAGRTVAPATARERNKVRYGLSVRVVLGSAQRGDGDNMWKCIADGLVDAGVIHSDARVSRWLLEVDDKERREPRTEISIEVLYTMSQLQMKTAALRRCLDTVRPALDRKVTIPILSTVKIESRDGALSMLATNLDHSIRVQTQEPYAGGAMAIVGERLTTWVKLQDADTVKLKEQDNGRVTLTCGRGRAQVPTMALASYPDVQFPKADNSLTMSQRDLLRGLKLVAFAISVEESRYTLNGALLEVNQGELRLVATDGHRLSLFKMQAEGAPQNNVLLPAGLCKILLGTLADSEESVTISWDDKKIGVLMQREGTGAIEVTSSRMTGQFPNYAAVLPREYPISFEVTAAGLLRAVQRSAAFADSRSGAAKCTFQPDGIKVLANDAEAGEADDFVEAATGMTLTISTGLNGEYLADALAKMQGDVTVSIKDPQSSVMFRNKPTDATELTYIVMPMRI